MFAVEGIVVATLILIFAPTWWLKLLLTGAFAILLAWVIGVYLLAPARMRHRLTPTDLELRFSSTRIDIPRDRIVDAEPVDHVSGPAFTTQPVDDPATGELRLTFSKDGLIRLTIDPPLELPRKQGPFIARHILFNADNRDNVLAALTTTDATPEPAQPDLPALTLPEPDSIPDDRELAIEALGLTRMFGARTALDNVTIRVHAGEIYGFIGPNGAGKTTTISMLTGLLAPTGGIVRIAGHDLALEPVEARRSLGYVPDRPVLYDTLTGREMLEFHAQMRGIPRDDATVRVDNLLAILDLGHRADELCRTYSFGMRNKLSLAAAMLHRPRVLILDEPFNGLDPQTSHSLRTLIIDQAARGTAVLLSTHDLALVERMCHRVGIIAQGRMLAEGAPMAIREQTDDLESAFLSLVGNRAQT